MRPGQGGRWRLSVLRVARWSCHPRCSRDLRPGTDQYCWYDFSSTMVEPITVLIRFLMAARSSLVKYTARASSMNFSPKRLARSSSRISSSMTQSFSLTRVRLASSSPRSTAAAPESFQVCSSNASSCLTLATLAASLMRAALMRRMVILSSSSPGLTGTRMSFMAAILSRKACLGSQSHQLVEPRGHHVDLDELHDAGTLDFLRPRQL